MIYPIEDAQTWAERYKLVIKTAKCPKCQVDITTDTPFAIQGYRGLKSIDHGCGEVYTRKVLVAVDKKEIEYWAGIAQII